MYVNKECINEVLGKLHPSIEYHGHTVEFELQYNSIQKCREAVTHFNNLIDLDLYLKTVDKGQNKTKLEYKDPNYTPELGELLFVENERILCKWDYNYWAERYYLISNAENKFILYSPNSAQKVWDLIDSRMEGRRIAVKRMNAKARQQGSTTHAQGKVQQRLQFFSDIKGVTSSFEGDATGVMSGMILDSLARQPYWLRPMMSNMKSDDYYSFENNSFLNLASGQNKTISTGTTPTVAHCSEVSRWKYPKESLYESLIPAMHEFPGMFLVLESTAKGRNNFWHDLWKESISKLENNLYLVYPSFIPYFVTPYFYPEEAWIRQRNDVFSTWIPSTDTIIHAHKARNYVISNPDLRQVLGSNYTLPKEKMFWYELMKGDAKKNGTLHIFLQEYPADPEEMFQNSGSGIYPIELINEYADKAGEKIPEVYKLEGDPAEINPEAFARHDEINYNKPRIRISANWAQGNIPASSYELVPIKFDGWDKFNPQNKILIWEHPIDGYEYGTSVDTSDGLGERVSDDAVIEGIRKGTIEANDRQVFEFASASLPQIQLWPYIHALATYFSTKIKQGEFWNTVQSLLTIEINKGEEAQNQLIKRGWWNLFRRYDVTSPQANTTGITRYGINTGKGNRPKLVAHTNSLLVGKWIEIYSMLLLSEFKDLEKNDNGKIAGKKDNRFMAFAIGLYALHRDEILGRQKASWEERRNNDDNSRIILPTFNESNYLQMNLNRAILPLNSMAEYEQGNLGYNSSDLEDFVNIWELE